MGHVICVLRCIKFMCIQTIERVIDIKFLHLLASLFATPLKRATGFCDSTRLTGDKRTKDQLLLE